MHSMLSNEKTRAGMHGEVEIHVYDRNGKKVDIVSLYKGYDIDDVVHNKTLEAAKEIMARVMAGDTAYKLAKVAFGNCGHDFDNTRRKVDPTVNDVELKASELIKQSLLDSAIDDFTYTHNNTQHRIVYIEKNITQQHVSFGDDGKRFVVEMPITYDDYNLRNGANQADETLPFVDGIVSYDLVMPDGTLGKVRNVDSSGTIVDGGNYTEVLRTTDDNNNTVFRFKNGLNANGEVDTTNGGYRPQELSEILLCTDVIGDGTQDSPYKKLASSRITSGLLVFPEGFNFVYKWSLTWNFQ